MDIDEFDLELESTILSFTSSEEYTLNCRKKGHPHYSVVMTCDTQDLRNHSDCNDTTNNCPGTAVDGDSRTRIYSSPTINWNFVTRTIAFGSISQSSVSELMCTCNLTLTEDMAISISREFSITGITDIYICIV